MKCDYCAGNLSIEDLRCPHCDAENPYYKAHRADMESYAKRYKDTENKVVESNKRFSAKAANITIIAVLVAFIAIAIGILSKMDDINYEIKIKKDTANASVIAANIGKMESLKDYTGISDYAQSFYVRQSYKTDLAEYSEVISVASSYDIIVSHMITLVYGRRSSVNASNLASTISRSLNSMYAEVYGERYLNHVDANYYAPQHYAAMEDMINRVHILFKTYLGFTQDEIDGLIDKTEAQRQVLLEEKLKEVIEDEE